MRVLLLNDPPGYRKALDPLPPGVEIVRGPRAEVAFVHLFVRSAAELRRRFPRAQRVLVHDGILWISWPKKTSGVITDITRDHGWEPVLGAGLRPVASISVDETWSALRFRPSERVGC